VAMRVKALAGLSAFLVSISPRVARAGHNLDFPVTQMPALEQPIVDTSTLEAPNPGVIIGIILVVVVIAVIIWWFMNMKRKKK